MVRVLLEEIVTSPLTAGDTGGCGDQDSHGLERRSAERGGDVGDPAVLADEGRAEVERHSGHSVVIADAQPPARRARSHRDPPLTVALTVIDLFGASTSLSTPVMVTFPVLLVEPASIVRVSLEEMVKSPLTAGDTGLADTVRVTASEEGRLREAVTSAIPPFSLMEGELRSILTVGAESSSVMVSVRLEGALTPSPPLTAADTVTDLSGAFHVVVDAP